MINKSYNTSKNNNEYYKSKYINSFFHKIFSIKNENDREETVDQNIYTKNYIFNYAKEKEENKSNEDFSFPPIVIDTGSSNIRAGLSGDEKPRVRIPTCIGYPNYENKGIKIFPPDKK